MREPSERIIRRGEQFSADLERGRNVL